MFEEDLGTEEGTSMLLLRVEAINSSVGEGEDEGDEEDEDEDEDEEEEEETLRVWALDLMTGVPALMSSMSFGYLLASFKNKPVPMMPAVLGV